LILELYTADILLRYSKNEEMFNLAVSRLKERSITHSDCISITQVEALQMLDQVEGKYRNKRHLTDLNSPKYSRRVAKAYKRERGTTGETGCRKSRRWKNLKNEA